MAHLDTIQHPGRLSSLFAEAGGEEAPHFEWPEESPVHLYLDFLLFGEGDVPTVTREILRRTGAKPEERPLVHVVG